MSGSRPAMGPYREPEVLTVPLTDEEIAVWDRAVCHAINGTGQYSRSVEEAAKSADRVVQERRNRFGVRGRSAESSTATGEPCTCTQSGAVHEWFCGAVLSRKKT